MTMVDETGEHLDVKHCETLEEVLRRVQFRTIDIESTRLDEDVTPLLIVLFL